jgi:hypothetical protein
MTATKKKSKESLVLKGDFNPKTIIKGEKDYGLSARQRITLEIAEGFITLWSKHEKINDPEQHEVYLYVFNRDNGSIWCGDIGTERDEGGKAVYKGEDAYLCVLNSFRSYLSDLFLMQPYDLRILETMDEVSGKAGKEVDNFLRILFKLLKT